MKNIPVRADYMLDGTIVPLSYNYEGTTIRIDRITDVQKYGESKINEYWVFNCISGTKKSCLLFDLHRWFLL